MLFRCFKICCILTALLLVSVSVSWGDEVKDSQTLGLLSGEETVVSTSRIPRPISRIAENVTVITADDISRLNAHTLSEVLQTVPGIQLDYLRTPSTFTFFSIQGALNTTVLVLIDGIRQNDFDQNIALPGLIPVQQIERIDIIKGAASGSWGSALGGVINIVTKSPNPDRAVSGMVSASTGTRTTSDSIAELSGTKNRFGYYLTAGHLQSNGLSANTATNMNNLYGKFTYQLPSNGTATFGLSHLAARPGLDEADTGPNKWGYVHDNDENRRTNAFLKLQQPLGDKIQFDVDGYVTNREDQVKWGGRDAQGAVFFSADSAVRDSTSGVNTSLTLGDSLKNLVTGFEYSHAKASSRDLINPGPPNYDQRWDRLALYGNGSYTIGDFTIIPGVRFDRTGLAGDHPSYTLGATYQLAENTTLRLYAAQGFSLPILATPGVIQKVKTIQGGVETGAVPFLWLKGTYFFNAVRDAQSGGVNVAVTNQNRQGLEAEIRTTPLHGLFLAGGYTYVYAKDLETGKQLQTNSQQTIPPHLFKVSLNYDQQDLGLRGALTGNYAVWNASSDSTAKSNGMVCDLHLNWKLRPHAVLSPELFFSAHNLLNSIQSADTFLYTNASRWLEGGARFKF